MGFKVAYFKSVFLILPALFFLAACAPKDQKVSNRGFITDGRGADISASDSKFSDRSTEYSRAALIQLADAARQVEVALRAVDAKNVAESIVPASPQALKVAACREVKQTSQSETNVDFETSVNNCNEKGLFFNGVQTGREASSAKLKRDAPMHAVATDVAVQGQGFETVLTPVKNEKDSLRIYSSHFLNARLQSESATERVYGFSFASYGSYSLNLKWFEDEGLISMNVSGSFVYDLKSQKIIAFVSADESDNFKIKVKSGRRGKNGGKVVRQEFLALGNIGNLKLDLETCALPIGEMKTLFTVGALGAKPEELYVNSKVEFISSADSILNKAKAESFKIAAKLCSSDQQITFTEFYAGLFY